MHSIVSKFLLVMSLQLQSLEDRNMGIYDPACIQPPRFEGFEY